MFALHKVKASAPTLSYFRACYVKFFDNERASAWQQGLKEAFDYFGGVPQQVLSDNAKNLIVKRDAYAEGEHKLHVEMLQMSKDYGFKLTTCQPYRAKTKGKVERFNHYLKNSFIMPLRRNFGLKTLN
ncbi:MULTISPECIES: DDE-type integrase/transposase/recombinase [unclassified Providencia]|uniref:DDE-type integrase/transposase/recombinase n=1 Tax=unclassified Providencia TaxID=2633465 RepID=UPI00234B98C2|nr:MULTISPECIES: DDE-type integrase/transposase/recombinase [unclassified Providencia]